MLAGLFSSPDSSDYYDPDFASSLIYDETAQTCFSYDSRE